MFPFLLNITHHAMCNVIPIKNVRIQLPLNDKSIFCDWIKTVPAARVPDILGSKMGYRAIKTSESETNFYRRCLNSEPKPAAAPGSSSEGILSDWISAFGRQADTVWSCPLSFLWRVDIIWHYLVTRWHYLTISWHCPLGHPKIDLWLYSFT